MSNTDDRDSPPTAASSMWNGWALGMFTSLSMLALVIAFFLSYSHTANALQDEAGVHAEQQSCITALRRCHDERFVPRICAMRARLGMENDEGSPVYGPSNVTCTRAELSEANYCDVARDACEPYNVAIPPID